MPAKPGQWLVILITGLIAVTLGGDLSSPCLAGSGGVSYERVVSQYLHISPNQPQRSCAVDIWALWEELGIPPRTMKEPATLRLGSLWPPSFHGLSNLIFPGRRLFNASKGQTVWLDCDFASSGRTKVISLTRDSFCTQVLVFHTSRAEDTARFHFAYCFTSGIDTLSDRSNIELIEPESGPEILIMGYRDNSGTGTYGFSRSLYRLDDISATCLLEIACEGWSVQDGPCGYGYHCEMTDLKTTWPKLRITIDAEYVPGDLAAAPTGRSNLVDVFQLDTRLELLWDPLGQGFKPSALHSLTEKELRTLISDPIGLLRQSAHDERLLALPNWPAVKKKVRRSDCLVGWGL